MPACSTIGEALLSESPLVSLVLSGTLFSLLTEVMAGKASLLGLCVVSLVEEVMVSLDDIVLLSLMILASQVSFGEAAVPLEDVISSLPMTLVLGGKNDVLLLSMTLALSDIA